MTATTAVRLRDVEWTDLALLAQLETELFAADAWSEETWWAELAGRPRRDYVLALDEADAVLGYAGLDVSGDTADVMTIATTSSARGSGVGRRLLDELLRRAAAHGAVALLLEVRADNLAARKLYDRSGFELISTRRRYYQPDDVDALVLRRHVRSEPHG
ncbi:MAG: ribosomal protein S18-alanine N-acetyltransferase [Terracoccus sp.]